MVDKTIDKAIEQIPGWMEMYRKEEIKSYYQYENVEDFVFGMCYGYIQSGFSHAYFLEHQQLATPEQVHEFVTVFNNRMREVKEAIFKTG